MSARKKHAEPPRPRKAKPAGPPPAASAIAAFDIDALPMIGEERMCIDHEENDNIAFMAEVIDC